MTYISRLSYGYILTGVSIFLIALVPLSPIISASESASVLIQQIQASKNGNERKMFFHNLEKTPPSNKEELKMTFDLADENKNARDASESIRDSLALMENIFDPELRKQIAVYIKEGKNDLSVGACVVLAGENKIVEAVDPLKDLIHRSSKRSREDYIAMHLLMESSEALAKINRPEGLAFLVEMLPNDDRTAKGIADFGVRGFDAVVPMRTAGFRSVILEMRDPEASSRLIGLLSDPDANTRRVAASALTYYPSDPKIAEVCIARIPIEKHDWTREELIKNIAKHGGESAIPLLIDLAKKERSYYAPIDGIKFIGGPQGKRALEQLQNEPKIGAYAKSSLNSLRVHEESMNIKAKKKSNAK